MMKASEFVRRLQDVVDNHKTLYVMGCFGAPLTGGNVTRYCNNHEYNQRASRTQMIKAAANQSPPVYGFDCVCLIKGILWGWDGSAGRTYGGAEYASNGVPDIGADTMIRVCNQVSTDFRDIIPGEAVWLEGHIGVYIGGGKVIECTPAFGNCVQVTALRNIGTIPGLPSRRWTKHGRLPYIDYDNKPQTQTKPNNQEAKPMSKAEIQSMVRQAIADEHKALLDNDASKYSEDARKWATEQGIIYGIGPGPDGEPNYTWEAPVTREQLIVILYRMTHPDTANN